jgi:peptidoglycan/xylan/chitin deacetylase (PgdA/CDA1 family)
MLIAGTVSAETIPAIAYHDIVERRGTDEFAITFEEFRRQMQYLRDEGYTPVSLRQLDAAHRGEAKLPAKPVLLSFDDGLASFVERALPVLREYGYPAVLAVVTAWVDGRSRPEEYRGRFLSWAELREIAARGDIEIISHSDNLHRGLRANPQGNLAPAVVTREYREAGRYETEDEFRARVRADLTRASARLQAELRQAPLAVAWPYGQFDAVLIEEATRLGMIYHLTLDDEPTSLDALPRINRSTFRRYRRLPQFDDMLTFRDWRTGQQRFVDLALDDFSPLAPGDREKRLSALLARLELLRVNAVVVSAFAKDGRGAFFPNPRIPVAADVLNRVIHQIRSRLRIDHVYLRLNFPGKAGDLTEVIRELSRLNRFTGVLFETRPAPAIVGLLRHHHPLLKILIPAEDKPAPASRIWTGISTGDSAEAIEARAQTALAIDPQALFLLRRTTAPGDEQLIAAMQALHRAGARHYGYDNDDFTRDRPALTRIGNELRAHVAAPGGGR